MSDDGLLFLHLAGVLLFVGGSTAAALLRLAAMRRSRPNEIALLLRAVRPVVPLVAVGLLTAIGSGTALAQRLDLRFSAQWLMLTFVLVGWLLGAGAVAGRQDRATRELAERLAATDDRPSAHLSGRLRDPVNLGINASILLAIIVIVALMVWKPGV